MGGDVDGALSAWMTVAVKAAKTDAATCATIA
jgi:hypothetical protein